MKRSATGRTVAEHWNSPPNEEDRELVRLFLDEVLQGKYGGKVRECARGTGIDHSRISRWKTGGPESVHHMKAVTKVAVERALGMPHPKETLSDDVWWQLKVEAEKRETTPSLLLHVLLKWHLD